jgi:predicted RND superfamily exporter protein/CRP-like cAMP-binding protein
MPNRFHRWVAAHAGVILAAITVLSLLALAQLIDFRTGALRLSIDPSLDAISTRSPAEQKLDNLTHLRFGNREPVMVMMQVDDVFKPENLIRLDQLSRALRALPGVESVDSLTATTLPRIDGEQLNYARVTAESLKHPRLPELLRNSARNNPLISGQLVSKDGRAAMILVHPAAPSELEILRSHLAERIRQTADRARGDGVEIFVSGAPLIRSAISATVTQQLKTIIPAIIGVIALLLAVVFHSLRAVLIPLLAISIGLLWILATFSFFGRPINLVSALVPPFIITMGLAYSAHVIAEHEHLLRRMAQLTPVERIARMLQEISTPVMVTGLATIAGLLALLLNEQRSMVEFAAFSALGTGYLMLLTLTLTPALLYFASPRQPGTLPAETKLERTIEQLSQFDQQRRPLILRVALVLFVLSLLLASRIEIGDTLIGLFPEGARIRIDHAEINRRMGGVTPLDIVIEGGSADVFTDPAIVRQLDALESWLAAQPEVGSVLGLPDHVKMLNRYLAGADSTIADSRDAIRQMLFVGDGDWLRSVVNIDRSATLIQLRLTVDDTAHIGTFIDRLNERLARLPAGLTARLSGGAVVMTESVRKATSGQLFSVGLALLLIYLCLSLQFMSLRVGLLATLPTVLQTALYFGILGLLGVALNPTSVLVESLVLGLAIDDTIHYLSRFASAAKRSGSEKKAATMALQAVLRPVTVTKSILALGFLTMVSGELTSQALFGWLAALTLFCTWLVDIFVTPAFMSGLRIVTLWDTLRLNLGARVQQTIPLFRGLSDRQSRIFALMSNLHTLPAGTRLITEGEQSGGIYVVIDGALSVFHGKGKQKQEISRMQRGDVVGEVGYFGQRRTASVDTLTETRLLRFEDEDQERLCKAYPNIASRVFLNLNRIQAKRQAAIRKLAETGATPPRDELERTGSFESRLI